MNVLICNERLLFRFGLDRVLLLLAEGLKARGHQVTLMANHLDADVIRRVADGPAHLAPTEGVAYIDLDAFTAGWLHENWDSIFGQKGEPDLVLVGGWPFYSSIETFVEHGLPTVYVDCGAVPLDGFEEGALRIHRGSGRSGASTCRRSTPRSPSARSSPSRRPCPMSAPPSTSRPTFWAPIISINPSGVLRSWGRNRRATAVPWREWRRRGKRAAR
jgi:hypothetical protein